MPKPKKLVLTGAAGRLGGVLRAPLAGMCETLVSSDIAEGIDGLAPNESYVRADLADMDAVAEAVEGAEMVVHFGAVADEAPFDAILGPNIVGAYNVWEAAHRTGARRVVYASSIHAVGMHLKSDGIGTDAPHRPDTFYGLSKCFTEDLARLYWDRRGMEAVCLRICSASGEVTNARALGTWLSDADLVRLVARAVDTPATGFAIAYGVSANDRAPVGRSGGGFLGYVPQDNAEAFAERVLAEAPAADPADPAEIRLGGPFCTVPLGESGTAHLGLGGDETD